MPGRLDLAKALTWCALLLPLTASAQLLRLFGGDDDPDKKEFVELEVKLPQLPKAENLIPFEASVESGNRFFIDAASITIGDDRVVRYTLMIRSPSGAENVSYEGMRCETAEQKYYAYGRRDGTWANARTSEWRPINNLDRNRTHRTLHRDYFCPVAGAVRLPKDAINRLKYGAPPGG